MTTISDCVAWSEARFTEAGLHFGHGCVSSRDEAIWAVLHVAGLMEHDYEQVRDRLLTDGLTDEIHRLVQRRISTRKPLAYLVQEAWFAGRSYYIDERAIVPRSHIGDLIQDGFGPWIETDAVRQVLDLCTGSGCIAVAMALEHPNVQVDAADLDEAALEVAKINIRRFDLGERVTPVQSDLFSALAGKEYDLIVTNPPYVDETAIDDLDAEYLHEPRIALAASESGIGVIRAILAEASKHLNEGGFLILEAGDSAELVDAAFPQTPFVWLTSRSGESVVALLGKADLDGLQADRSR